MNAKQIDYEGKSKALLEAEKVLSAQQISELKEAF